MTCVGVRFDTTEINSLMNVERDFSRDFNVIEREEGLRLL